MQPFLCKIPYTFVHDGVHVYFRSFTILVCLWRVCLFVMFWSAKVAFWFVPFLCHLFYVFLLHALKGVILIDLQYFGFIPPSWFCLASSLSKLSRFGGACVYVCSMVILNNISKLFHTVFFPHHCALAITQEGNQAVFKPRLSTSRFSTFNIQCFFTSICLLNSLPY